jgi:WD40 repeat protein
MSTHTPCPDPARLHGLLETNLPEAEQAALVGHLDSCTSCQHSLEEMAGGTPWSGVAQAGSTPPPRDSAFWPALRAVENEVLARTQLTVEVPAPAPAALEFLIPPDKPGYIGRLGHFDVVEVIGRGGMGIVLRAFDPCLQRPVAIKVLDPQLATNETAHQRFCREARAAAAITHGNVVAIHQVEQDETSELPFLVMQLVTGVSLQERLDQGGPMPLKEVLEIGLQAAWGLAAAHAQGLIHRDIKPANILLDAGPKNGPTSVKITDFGLARAAEDVKLTQTGFVAGTPLYMAPEQAKGEQVDHRADLFSLGSVLYAMCTGRPPFEGSTPFVVLKNVTEELPRPIREVNPDIPGWLVDVIARLHAKKPADRYQSAGEVANVLLRGLMLLQHAEAPRCPLTGRRLHALRDRTWALAPLLLLVVLGGLGVTEASGLTRITRSFTAGVVTPANPPDAEGPSPALLGTLQGNSGPVWAVQFSPDGKTVAMAIDDGDVKLWEAGARRVRATLGEHRGPVWAAAFRGDGKVFATASDDGLVKLWDPTTGKEVSEPLRYPQGQDRGSFRAVASSPDGKRLVTGTRDGRVTVWDVDSGAVAFTSDKGHAGIVVSVAVSPDGKTIASGSGDKTVKLWDAATGQEQQTLKNPEGGVYSVAFSPDGKTLATGGWDKKVRLWEVGPGTNSANFAGHKEDVWSVAFSPDGKTLASGSEDKTVKLWDVATGRELATFRGHEGAVYAVAFSPDGKTVASGSRDGTVRLWDASARQAAKQ